MVALKIKETSIFIFGTYTSLKKIFEEVTFTDISCLSAKLAE